MTPFKNSQDIFALYKLVEDIGQRLVDAPLKLNPIVESVKVLSDVLQNIVAILSENPPTAQQIQDLDNISKRFQHHLKRLEDTIQEWRYVEGNADSETGKSSTLWSTQQFDRIRIGRLRTSTVASTDAFRVFLRKISRSDRLPADRNFEQTQKENENILQWLSATDYATRHKDILSRKLPNTGTQDLRSDTFQQWVNKGGQIIFCTGIPGVGKTTVLSTAIDDLQARFKDNAQIGLAYIYYDITRSEEQDETHVIANIIKQLVPRGRMMPICARGLHIAHYEGNSRPLLQELATALHKIVNHYTRVFIFVDAIDESKQKSYAMVHSVLAKLVREKKCNLFITCQMGAPVISILRDYWTLEIRTSKDDIISYLDQVYVATGHRAPREVSTSRIVQAANKVFLLAQLYADRIQKSPTSGTLDQITDDHDYILQPFTLDGFSRVLKEAYCYVVQNIQSQPKNDQDLAKSALLWITYAYKPLSPTALLNALAVNTGERKLDPERLFEIEKVTDVCHNLISIDKQSNVVRLMHYTTWKHLKETPEFLSNTVESHSYMAGICLAYLSFEDFERGMCTSDEDYGNRLQLYPLYVYAARNWGHHARLAQGYSLELNSMINEFLEPRGAKLLSSIQAMFSEKRCDTDDWYSQRVPTEFSSLHIAAFFGLRDTVVYLISKGHDADAHDSVDRTPLAYASEHGHESVVEVLLATGADKDSQDFNSCTPLILAAKRGHLGVVRLLLDAGASPTIEENSSNTPLSFAAANGHTQIVQLLLKCNGVDANAKNFRRYTPLTLAASHGHVDVVKILLDVEGVDPQSRDISERTPLFHAASKGHALVVQLLLSLADLHPDPRDINLETPLSFAAMNGHLSVVEILLSAGADPNSRSYYNWTPLFHAAAQGNLYVAEMLLTAGADKDCRDLNNQKPFMLAALNDSEALIRSLLPISKP